jgi:hypothetical protein
MKTASQGPSQDQGTLFSGESPILCTLLILIWPLPPLVSDSGPVFVNVQPGAHIPTMGL